MVGAAASIAAVTVASRVVGFGRVGVLSRTLGTSCVGDTYSAANAIPNVVFDAVNRSYQVVVVGDAVAGTPAEYGTQVLDHSLSLVATLATTDELVAAW